MAVADIQGGINFLCQRCQQPLKLSSTLYSLDEHTLAELSLPISPAHNIDIESQVTSNCCHSLTRNSPVTTNFEVKTIDMFFNLSKCGALCC